MRRPRAAVGLAVVALLGGCVDSTPRGSGSSIGPESAEHTAFRGPLHAKLTFRPSQPPAGRPVEVTLAATDDEGGDLTLSVSYDGGRPDDEGTTQPATCPPRSQAGRAEQRTFDRPGDYRVRLLVISERCNGKRATVEVRATLTVRPAA